MTTFNMQNSITEGVEMQNGTQAVKRLLQAAGFLSGLGFDVCVAVSAPSCVQFWASDTWKNDLKNIMRQATNSQANLRKENMKLDMLVKMESESRTSCSTQTASPPEFDSSNKIVPTENEITGSHVIVEEFIKVELTSNDGIKKGVKDCIEIPEEEYTTENIQRITREAEVEGFPAQNVPSPKGVKNKDGLLCCELCNFKCKYRYQIETHARVHTGERPFKCGVCGVGRTQASHLREHMRIHTGEKPFACDFCEYRCSQSSALRHHKLRNHIKYSGTLKSPPKSRRSLRRRGNSWHIKPGHNS